MKRYYILPILVEIDDKGEWDCGCDETHALMRLVHRMKSIRYTYGEGPKVSEAFLLRDYTELTASDFQTMVENTMDKKGV